MLNRFGYEKYFVWVVFVYFVLYDFYFSYFKHKFWYLNERMELVGDTWNLILKIHLPNTKKDLQKKDHKEWKAYVKKLESTRRQPLSNPQSIFDGFIHPFEKHASDRTRLHQKLLYLHLKMHFTSM